MASLVRKCSLRRLPPTPLSLTTSTGFKNLGTLGRNSLDQTKALFYHFLILVFITTVFYYQDVDWPWMLIETGSNIEI